MMLRLILILALAWASAPGLLCAQLFSYESESPRPTQAISGTVGYVDFEYAGGGTPSERFDFDDAVYGILYSRPNVQVSVLVGTHEPQNPAFDQDRLQLIDAAFFTWGEIGLSRKLSGGTSRLFIPILLHSNHRRVAKEDEATTAVDAFSVTVLGIGTGLGAIGQLEKLQVEARATPVIGIATRSFGDATGSSWLFDGDLLVHVGPLLGRFGFSVGYGFRIQSWNVGTSDLIQDVEEDFFDYSGLQHTARLGLNW